MFSIASTADSHNRSWVKTVIPFSAVVNALSTHSSCNYKFYKAFFPKFIFQYIVDKFP